MRIIEGYGPPSPDTFGNPSYMYKDLDTGAFYRCHGNINEDRVLPYGPAHRHPGERYVWTPVPYEETEVSEAVNIVWDGNTEGLICVPAEGLSDTYAYRISDRALTNEQIKSIDVYGPDGSFWTSLGNEWDGRESDGYIRPELAEMDGYLFVREAGAEWWGSVFEHVGVYRVVSPNNPAMAGSLIGPEQTETVVHKMDPKFLPNGQKMVYAYTDGQGELYKDPECDNPYMKDELFALGLNFVIRITHGDPNSALRLRAPVQMDDDGDRARVIVCTTNGANMYYYSGEDVGPM